MLKGKNKRGERIRSMHVGQRELKKSQWKGSISIQREKKWESELPKYLGKEILGAEKQMMQGQMQNLAWLHPKSSKDPSVNQTAWAREIMVLWVDGEGCSSLRALWVIIQILDFSLSKLGKRWREHWRIFWAESDMIWFIFWKESSILY